MNVDVKKEFKVIYLFEREIYYASFRDVMNSKKSCILILATRPHGAYT